MAHWIISNNSKDYKIINAFIESGGIINQFTSKNIEIDDIVFIYRSAPEKRIICETRVVDRYFKKIGEIDDYKFFRSEKAIRKSKDRCKTAKYTIRLKAIKYFDEEINYKLTFNLLQINGCTGTFRSPVNLDNGKENSKQLLNYIKSVTLK